LMVVCQALSLTVKSLVMIFTREHLSPSISVCPLSTSSFLHVPHPKALRYGTRSQGISVLPAHPAFISYRNETYLPLPSPSQQKLVLIYRPRRDGRLSWPYVAGQLHSEISVWHRELNPDTVAHLSTNRARCRLISLIEANMLTTTPDHQIECSLRWWWPSRWERQYACASATQEKQRVIVKQQPVRKDFYKLHQ